MKQSEATSWAYLDADGRYADFHSFRHLYVRALSEVGQRRRLAKPSPAMQPCN